MEDPTTEVHKSLHEEAEKSGDKTIMKIALSSALIAVLAATASLLSEHQSNEAMMEQMKASDNWAYYQAKGIKSAVLEARIENLKVQDKKVDSALEEKIKAYKKDQEDLNEKAKDQEKASARHIEAHNWLSYSVTLFQVAIGVSAISALTRRRWLWISSMVVGLGGLGLLAWGVFRIVLPA